MLIIVCAFCTYKIVNSYSGTAGNITEVENRVFYLCETIEKKNVEFC